MIGTWSQFVKKRNKEVAEGKENTKDCYWVKLDIVYDLQPGDKSN